MMLSSIALTLANHRSIAFPRPPACAVACGATNCLNDREANFGNLKCCPCFEFRRRIERPAYGQNETELYVYCVRTVCPQAEYEEFRDKLQYLYDYGHRICVGHGQCIVYDYSKTWPENEMIRIQLAKATLNMQRNAEAAVNW